jgi:hypothetical protein
MACRSVTILRARRNSKFYGHSEQHVFLDQSRARIVVVVYGYGSGRPVETLYGGRLLVCAEGILFGPVESTQLAFRRRAVETLYGGRLLVCAEGILFGPVESTQLASMICVPTRIQNSPLPR